MSVSAHIHVSKCPLQQGGAFLMRQHPFSGPVGSGRGGPMQDRQFVRFPIFFIFLQRTKELYRDEGETLIYFLYILPNVFPYLSIA